MDVLGGLRETFGCEQFVWCQYHGLGSALCRSRESHLLRELVMLMSSKAAAGLYSLYCVGIVDWGVRYVGVKSHI